MKKVVLLLLAISISALIYLIIDENKITDNVYLANFRMDYPKYKDIPDLKLSDAIHETFYKDISIEEYYLKFGLENPKQKQMIKQMLYVIIPFLLVFYFMINKKYLLEKARSILISNIKILLIGLFVLSFLFLLFLNSGGLYEYKSNSQGVPIFRVNKITNNIQSLSSDGWVDVMISKKHKE